MTTNAYRLESLKEIVGPEYIKGDAETLSTYSVDGMKPWAVVFPGDIEQVSEVVQLAGKEKLALIPWGSGSKIAMGNPPLRVDLAICTSRLNRVIGMDTANLTVTVQAGMRFKDIQSILGTLEGKSMPHKDPADRGEKDCFIPLSPPCIDSATLGGIIAANSSGPTRLLYGLPRDIVLGVRYVASNGEIIRMGGKTVKNVSGYDMCKLMIGSQGSLGILCEVTLRLLPLPERSGTFVSTFASLSQASSFVDLLFQTSLLPASVEILNSRAYEPLRPDAAAELKAGGYAAAVALEGVQEAVDRMSSEIREMALESGAKGNSYIQEDQHGVFWEGYSNLVPGLSDSYPDLVSFKLNYPISRYLEVIELADSLISDRSLDHALLAHAGSGITMIHILLDQGNTSDLDRIVSVAERLLDRCRAIGGNLVIDRAKPEIKRRLPVWGLSREDLMVMKRIKNQMDPLGVFCPGRFVGRI